MSDGPRLLWCAVSKFFALGLILGGFAAQHDLRFAVFGGVAFMFLGILLEPKK